MSKSCHYSNSSYKSIQLILNRHRELKPIPAGIEQETGYTSERSLVSHKPQQTGPTFEKIGIANWTNLCFLGEIWTDEEAKANMVET